MHDALRELMASDDAYALQVTACEARQWLAANPNLTAEVARLLCTFEEDDADGHHLLAENVATPDDVLHTLVTFDDDAFELASVAAGNPKASTETLIEILALRDLRASLMVLIHPNRPESVGLLSPEDEFDDDQMEWIDEYWDYVCELLRPDSSDTELREFLNVAHASASATSVVLRHPHASEELIVERLTRDALKSTQDYTRAGAAAHPKTPEPLLRALSEDPFHVVRGRVGGNPSTPADLLPKLARDPDPIARGNWNWGVDGVGRNINAPEELLRLLAQDESPHVRGNVAMNPMTPPDLLEQLAFDPDPAACGPVAGNPNASWELIMGMVRRNADPVWVAGHAKTPVEALNDLAGHEQWTVRRQVHANPSASDEAKARALLLGITKDSA